MKKLLLLSLSLTASCLVSNVGATVTTWDLQGTTGANPYTGSLSGTWENADWSTSQTGQATPQAWVENTAALFAVHSGTGTPAFTVTMNSNHSVGGIFDGSLTPNPCPVTISGPGIFYLEANNLDTVDPTSDAGDPGTVVFAGVIGGTTTGGICSENGAGSTYLNGLNTYPGGTYLGYSGSVFSGGFWYFNSSSSFGTGPIYLLNCSGGSLLAEGTSPITIPNSVINYAYYPNYGVPEASSLNLVGNAAGVTFSGPWIMSGGTGGTGAPGYTTTSPLTGGYGQVNIGSGTAANYIINISGVISGNNTFNKYGVGILQLSATNTFSGNMSVTNGTLALVNGGSINSVSNLTIYTNGTFDVTGTDPYTLSSSTVLNATGTGIVQGGTAATINDSTSGGIISLSTNQINLTFIPTAFTGDSAHPSLYVSGGALALSGNVITVTNAAATKLGAGTYTLIQVTDGVTGTITGTPAAEVVVAGTGLAAGTVATASVVGSTVVMTVAAANTATTTTLASIPSINYGSKLSVTATATVSPTPTGGVPDNGTVQFYFNGAEQGDPVAVVGGVASLTWTPPSTTAAGTYPVTAVYSGTADAQFGSSTAAAVNLVINKAVATVTASATATTYGTLSTYSFVATPLSNSDVIASVTYTVTGGTNPGTTNEYAGTYTVTPSAAAQGAGGPFVAANYTITYVPATLTVNPKAATITATAESYTYGTAYTGLGTLKTTNFSQSGFVNGNNATNATVTLACTTNASAATATAPVAGSPYGITPSALALVTGKSSGTYTNFNPANYTITYAPANLTENPLAVKLSGSQPYTGITNWIEANSLAVSNKVSGDTVYVAQGLGFTAVAEPPGVWSIASFGTLVLGNAGGQGTGLGTTPATDQFNAPGSLAVDSSGNLYVADTANNRVCEITPAGVQTVVPFTGLSNCVGVAVDVFSNIYVVCPDQNAVFEMPNGGSQTTMAFSGLNYPTGLAVDAAGDVFVSDTLNNRVLELPVGGSQTTVAGLSVILPAGLCVDTNGDIFVVNSGSNNVVELPTNGVETVLSTFTGYSFPASLAVDNYTNVYLASYASTNIRVLSLGIASPAQTTDFNGLSECEGVAVDPSGDLFAVDSAHNRIAELPISGTFGPAPMTYGAVTYFGTTVANNYTMTGASGVITNTATPAFSGLTASPTVAYGAASVTLSGSLTGPGSTYPTNATITITINGNAQTVTVATGGAFTKNYNSATLPASATPYTITYTSAASGALNPATNTSTTLTVNPAPLTVTANNETVTYGTNALTLSGGSTLFTAALSNSQTIGTVTLTFSTTNAGTGAITPSAATGGTFNSANYNITYNTGTLTVNPLTVVLTGSEPYNGTATAAFGYLSVANAIGSDNVTVASGTATLAGATVGPEAILSAAGLTLGGLQGANYTVTGASGTVTVGAVPLSITASAQSATYGTLIPLGNTQFTTSGLQPGDSIATATLAVVGYASNSPVGAYVIVPSAATGSFNAADYSPITYNTGTLTVNPLAVVLTGTQSYNGTTNATNSILSVTNMVGSDVVTLAATGSAGMDSADIGTNAITSIEGLALSGASATNYTLAGVSGEVIVTALPVALTGTRPYDGTATASYSILSITNIAGSDDVALAASGSAALAGLDAGIESITNVSGLALTGSASANYTLTNATGSVTVTPVALIITANPVTKTYGTAVTLDPTAFTVGSGLVGSEMATAVTMTANGGTAATDPVSGSPYAITPSAATGTGGFLASNYAITYNPGALTVNPLALVLSGTRLYDGTATAAFGILSISDVVGSDNVTLASGNATLAASSVGPEAITAPGTLALGGTAAGNYTLIGVTGSVQITNPETPFSISAPTISGTNIVLVWSSIPGVTYQVIGSIDLLSWTNAGAPITATGVLTTDTVPINALNQASFYQVGVATAHPTVVKSH